MVYNKEEDYFLDDLPHFFHSIQILSVHGKGKGGGEIVAEKIMSLFAQSQTAPKTIKIGSEDGFLKRFLAIYKSKTTSTILLTAGLRDIDLLVYCVLLHKKVNLYNQVPFLKATSFTKDFMHFFFVKIYAFVLRSKAITLFTNSKNCIHIKGKENKVILPFFKKELVSTTCKPVDVNKMELVFGTAFRLNTERGLGSKDLNAIINFCKRVDEKLKKRGVSFSVKHFGQFEEKLALILQEQIPNIEFHGYTENWTEHKVDAYFFISRYEGFGLAALEASSRAPVYVNEAFPKELFLNSSNVHTLEYLFKIL